MKYKILKSNWLGKIYFTEEELCNLLEEVYADGIKEGLNQAKEKTTEEVTPKIDIF